MYDVWPNAILGFHGCDAEVAHSLLNKPNDIKISKKKYDWLGHGMYFWENNFERARNWAENKALKGDLKNPAVIGAVLQLGHCCDLLDSKYIQTVCAYYDLMDKRHKQSGTALPKNKDLLSDGFKDKILRELDCAVIQFMHSEIFEQIKQDEKANGFSDLRLFDSTRGAFTEGGPAFEGAALLEKTHIQVCIRNLNCIKGFFLPRKEVDFRKWVEQEMK